jgi:hypothetical protein
MKKVLIVCGIVIVVIASVFITRNVSQPNNTAPSVSEKASQSVAKHPTPTARPTEKIMFSGWTVFTTDNFSIQYPKEITATNIEPSNKPTTITLEYKGNETNNEDSETVSLTNGYSLDIIALPVTDLSLQTYVQNANDGARVECRWNAIIAPVRKIDMSNHNGLTFSTTNCVQPGLISTQYYASYSKGIIQITTITAGNIFQRLIYQNDIKKILSTLKIY